MSNEIEELTPEDFKLIEEIESMTPEELHAALEEAGIDTSPSAMRASAMRILKKRLDGIALFCGVSGIGMAVMLVPVDDEGEPDELYSVTQDLADGRARAPLADAVKRLGEVLATPAP